MWSIFRHDMRRIFTNPIAIIVTIGIAILPSAYAWLNIISNWDPYQNTQNISVAVANLDRGGNSDITGDINVGRQLEEQLKDNHRLGWKFLDSREEAIDGVSSGKYYAAIVIDKDFSQKLVDMVTSGGNQPELQYYVNEKLNPVAPKITDSGATTLDRTVNSAFVGTLTKAVSSQLNVTVEKAQQIVQGAHSQAIQKVDEASQSVTRMRDQVASARESLTQTASSTSDVKKAIEQVKLTVDAASQSAEQASRTASTLSQSSRSFSNNASNNLSTSAASLSALGIVAGQAGTQMSSSLSRVSGDIATVSGTLNGVIAQNNSAITQLQRLLDSSALDHNSTEYQQLNSALAQLQTTTTAHSNALNDFTRGTQSALTSANTAASTLSSSLGSAAQSGASALNNASSALQGPLGQSLSGTLDSASVFAQATSSSLRQLDTTLTQSQDLLDQLHDLLTSSARTMGTTEESLSDAIDQLDRVRTDMAALDSSRLVEALRGTNINAQALGDFMQSPIEMEQKTIYPVANYGSAIAPFFTNIALWVGGFVLIAVVKIEVDRKNMRGLHERRRIRNRDAYMGRWLLFAVVGVAQAIIATVGDLIIGIQVKDPVAFIFAGVFASIVFVSLIYALAATFKHIGKALAVILVIMQVPGSSGTYPIEIMPPFFQRLEPWLPFTYSINAMRETIGGYYDGYYWKNLGTLTLFLVFSFILGILVRPYLSNLNALFDRRLADTDLLIGEHAQEGHARFRLNSVLQSMMSRQEFGQSIRRRAARFAAIYPRLVGWGIGAILVVPVLFLVLLFTVESKLVFLMLWLISVVLLDFYLISLEYIREVYERELGMSVLSDDALKAQILEHISHRWNHETDKDDDDNTDEDVDSDNNVDSDTGNTEVEEAQISAEETSSSAHTSVRSVTQSSENSGEAQEEK
ncbi:YhgE/Pip domain-containing protein [Alloscardovia theropitheci]|uniref:YhgE/Pip domain-containing protein n=1 Tax=Alloscardovia theropitheci TaxID=2496842 RepID=A0A4R0QT23_9BIFI|nr:YhgE/Pip domain-containing protein [Alloscardovia theropitheci]TCD54355.1 YhgE/Pip domain-containing protein [Alloscardovia theropitheci]